MIALFLLEHLSKRYTIENDDDEAIALLIKEAIIELEELQEELRISDEAYALLLKEYHELKDKQ